MGQRRAPTNVKLIAGMIASDAGIFERAKRTLEKKFKTPVDYESADLDFTYTDYYRSEMGGGLKRKFLSFKKDIPPDRTYRLKIVTNALEKSLSPSNARMINIDPGYLDLAKVVLFSTKDYAHRIYLGGGIFAENTLFYKDGTFNPWPWTYPDYKTAEYIEIFNAIRAIFKKGMPSKS